MRGMDVTSRVAGYVGTRPLHTTRPLWLVSGLCWSHDSLATVLACCAARHGATALCVHASTAVVLAAARTAACKLMQPCSMQLPMATWLAACPYRVLTDASLMLTLMLCHQGCSKLEPKAWPHDGRRVQKMHQVCVMAPGAWYTMVVMMMCI